MMPIAERDSVPPFGFQCPFDMISKTDPPADDACDDASDLRSFGRRRGRALSARQASLLTNDLPRLAIDMAAPPPASATELFGTDISEVWLEIGFGGAEHLLWQAERNPTVGLLGC
jgi:hypothetical protein